MPVILTCPKCKSQKTRVTSNTDRACSDCGYEGHASTFWTAEDEADKVERTLLAKLRPSPIKTQLLLLIEKYKSSIVTDRRSHGEGQ